MSPLLSVARPWDLVGLAISILITLSIAGGVFVIISQLIRRPPHKPELPPPGTPQLEGPVNPKQLAQATAGPAQLPGATRAEEG